MSEGEATGLIKIDFLEVTKIFLSHNQFFMLKELGEEHQEASKSASAFARTSTFD